MSEFQYGPLSADLQPALATIVAESFNFDPETSKKWMFETGLENWRAVHQGGTVMAGLMQVPMGQWFGGREVSMTGIAGVVVSPKARGRGVGQKLIRDSLRELRDKGVGLSALYASTTSFYRRNGYELGGPAYYFTLKLKEIEHRSGGLEIRDLQGPEFAEAELLQDRCVRQHGALKRGPYLRHRVRRPKGEDTQAVGFFGESGLEGYLFYRRASSSQGANSLHLSDLVLSTPAARETFLGYLAGHRAVFDTAEWQAAESMPFLADLPEKWNFDLSLMEYWMLRVVDLKAALESRGYPPGVHARLSFELQDSVLTENRGVWELEVAEGRGRLNRTRQAGLSLDAGALASLYTGFLNASQLQIAGRLEGSVEALTTASLIFAGKPVLCDFF